MSEHIPHAEQEPRPRAVTGLFQLRMGGVRMELSPEGKALPAGGEPYFAVNEVMVTHSRKGWQEFSERLSVRLEGIESELYRGEHVHSVALGPWPELTDSIESGDICYISQEEYRDAYLRKYGDTIQGPMFL